MNNASVYSAWKGMLTPWKKQLSQNMLYIQNVKSYMNLHINWKYFCFSWTFRNRIFIIYVCILC